ncbi:MAG: hypothetical protein EXS31_08800 [Pedosphaera sp.]|nr:hypothetical protein [Pedosphaera sp.]
MSTRQPNEETILEKALSFASPDARQAYLQGACGDDQQLHAQVQSLIDAHEAAGGFLPDKAAEDAPTQAAGVAFEKAGDRIGRYKLLQQIGEGGCGVVYMAEQTEPVKRRVALKVIKLGMDTKSVIARFEAERQALALMDHPNIAKVLDGGATDAGRPYFVMELIRGTKITEYCDETKLSTRQRLDLFIQVCQAIQHAHQKGIIHRDIKPSNILVTVNDGVPVPKVIDFGIAKATNQQQLTDKTVFTAFEQFIGTPAYMSPEQAVLTSVDIDTRSDIYSLGVLLYEMLTGKTPLDAKELLSLGLDETRRAIREKEPVRPSTRLRTMQEGDLTSTAKHRQIEAPKLVQQLSGDVDWIVMKCLEKDRAWRYETANSLASDLQRHLNNEAVLARPPSAAYRFQKLVRRNKLAFAAITSVAAVLVLGVVVSTWQAIRATRAEREQNRQREAAVEASASEAAQRRIAVEQQRKAETAQASEAEQRSKADAEKITAERHRYVVSMNLAQQAWEQNNFDRLRQLLEETRESSDRGFEWYYWQRQTHLDLKTLRGHLATVTSVAFSPNGQRIVTGSYDQTAKVWDAASGREMLTLQGHSGGIRSVAFSPDGQRIVTGSHDHTAKVWDAANGRELRTLKGHGAQIYSVAFSPDGQRIVTGSGDNTAKLWEAASGRELLTFSGHTALIWSVAFSPDGQRIVTGSYDQTAKVWEVASGLQLLTLKGHGGGILTVAFSPDSQRILTGSGIGDETARVWDAASGRELLTLKRHTAQIRSAAYSPDGQRIVTGSLDQTAKVWEAASGRELLTLKGHGNAIYSVAFSPDGQRIVTGSKDQTAKVWEASIGRDLLTLKGHSAAVYSVAFSPDSQRIVTGSWDHTARVWEAASGRELLALQGHDLGILSVAFSSDGQRIVTGSWDQTARVWEAASGRELLALKRHGASYLVGGFFARRPADCHGQLRSDGQGVGGGEWPGTADAQGAQRSDFVCGLFPGRPADCHRQ